jgi:signal transduction histidine kinase/CheY-like chemotaxis protein
MINQFSRIAFIILLQILMGLSISAQSKIDSLKLIIQTKNFTGKESSVYLSLATEFIKTNPDSTIFYALQANKIAGSNKDSIEFAKSLSTIAEAYQYKSELKTSSEYYWKAIEIAERNEFHSLLGSSYNGMGLNFYYMDDMTNSELYLHKAANAKLKAEEYVYYSAILTNLASLYFYKEQYAEAIKIVLSAEQTLYSHNKTEYLPSIYNTLGAIYKQTNKNLDSAVYYYYKSIEFAEKYNIKDNILVGYHNLGELYYQLKNYPKAIFYMKKAEDMMDQASTAKYKIGVYALLSSIHEAKGDYKNALEYKHKHFNLNQELFQHEKQKAIDELQIKYETVKKEQEIETQKKEIETAKIKEEQAKNRFYLFVLISVLIFVVVVFVFVFILFRKKQVRHFEQEKLRIFENIVHDIRTPVTLINGPLQELKKKLPDNTSAETNIQLMERNSEKLLKLVNELLDASKIDKGKYSITMNTGNIDFFIKEVLSVFSLESNEKKISIHFESKLPDENFIFCADILEKIIVNLVSNALKYCPENSKIEIFTSYTGSHLKLTIKDDGPGIPKNEQKKIFTRFYRRNEHKNLSGTGIGLSIVKNFVDILEGKIELESEPEKGTKFTLTIPINIQVITRNAKAENDESKLELLLCDDDKDIVLFVESLLENDFNLSIAQNGEEALDIIKKQHPDIILSDVMMPIKDGLDLLKDIKTDTLLQHIPVVMFSSKSSLENRLKGLQAGADAYIGKPFNPDELKLILKNLSATIQKNKQDFLKNVQSEKTFDERIKSKNEYVNKAIAFVVANMDDFNYSVNELASDMCISRSQLHRKLTTYTGFSTSNFIKMIRLERAKDMLLSNEGNVTEIAYSCGFNSQSYFSASFTEYFGESPVKFLAKKRV